MNNVEKFPNSDIGIFADAYFEYLKKILDDLDRETLRQFVMEILAARDRGATVFLIGNGGSAATASHFANDFCFGTDSREKPFKFISLTDNVASISALGNDYGYEYVFVKQLEVLSSRGDVLVGISASGNSPNLVHAFRYASENGIKCLALTGFSGGKLKELSDITIHAQTQQGEYGPTEDVHMILDHLISNFLRYSR